MYIAECIAIEFNVLGKHIITSPHHRLTKSNIDAPTNSYVYRHIITCLVPTTPGYTWLRVIILVVSSLPGKQTKSIQQKIKVNVTRRQSGQDECGFGWFYCANETDKRCAPDLIEIACFATAFTKYWSSSLPRLMCANERVLGFGLLILGRRWRWHREFGNWIKTMVSYWRVVPNNHFSINARLASTREEK